ncbi:nitrate reductase [Eremomyces bilateralis CBS 781.70]|uniref:Nitrate reductase [NADPH] n=1 Tax=Eremomyces bilateralis CBS 781.70 TaxID=1392243 RepID=A0A6G1GEU0_9PEZI|nr:nitrate reductase [Eremomyces bilateralis CBS 781.70]KAF1816578.1 nitrate reductase [Eremomyces bilateralis CBS 781.70]
MATPSASWNVVVGDHPGSSWEDIFCEPDWAILHGHNHHVGYKNRENRTAGLTSENEGLGATREVEDPSDPFLEISRQGKFVSFRDLFAAQPDYHLTHPENRSLGWRYALGTTEDWVKYGQAWPANIQAKKKETQSGNKDDKQRQAKQEDGGDNAGNDQDMDGAHVADEGNNSEQAREHAALLKVLKEEADYIRSLGQNDGRGESPHAHSRPDVYINEADQFTPDNWLPRTTDFIRLTGKHPLNAEPHLTHLFHAGLITPNELHYVRNHGAVPRLLWEDHKLDIHHGKLVLSMDDLKTKFDPINIPVALACDGNRRRELNMIRRSAGFNWGAGAVSCAYWRGPLLRDVLLAAGFPDSMPSHQKRRYWVNFEGSDELSEGKYATCIPLKYAMDVTNDVILAYDMNDRPLPPDHGYPVRVIIPGYVGGRCVKWLRRIWITDHENDSYYHLWDNRVLPSFIKEKEDELAAVMFSHPDTSCNEQNLNSVIAKPAHGERIKITGLQNGQTYRVAGYAYDGGGHEIQRVELSLDDGRTWLYCVRRFPDAPIRHGKKFWTWVHWHIDVPVMELAKTTAIAVRCFNVFKNTQPREPSWNIMGMMNNCWYVVKHEVVEGDSDGELSLLIRHPVEPGTGNGGWMKPSIENQLEEVKREAGTPKKQFTRAEIEGHDKENDCWIVVDGKVYDATSVLSWHPGGKSAILGHAGKVHQETSDEFSAIHDDFAYQKLKECILGTVTDKVRDFIQKRAEDTARELEKSGKQDERVALKKHRWVPVKLLRRERLSGDTRSYTFSLLEDKPMLGLGTCQHVQVGFHMKDKMLIRSYTPTKPILPAPGSGENQGNRQVGGGTDKTELTDGSGTFELTVKTYFPDQNQPGGAMSNLLDCMPLGEEIELRGPTGEIVYNGQGLFDVEGKHMRFKHVSLVLGGSGITPGYALVARILLSDGDSTPIRVVDANKSESDILLKGDLDRLEEGSEGRLKVTHVLSHPSEKWEGLKGFVNPEILKGNLFKPEEGSVVFMCGPPAMIQKAVLPALKDWGYIEGKNMFGF